MKTPMKSKKQLSEIEQNVQSFLDAAGVVFNAVYQGESKDDEWQRDDWLCKFNKDGLIQAGFEYHTGIGHREYPKVFLPEKFYNPRCIAAVEQENRKQPVFPCAASVLYCLISDAEALDTSFEYWCDDYGCDNDSLKAFNTYQQCCNIGKQLKRVFTREEINKLQEMLQDY